MTDQGLAEQYKLDIVVLDEERSREIHYRPDPHQLSRPLREITMWNRTLRLADNVSVYKSPQGQLRVIKQVSKVSREDSRLNNYASELEVLGQVSNVMRFQNKHSFVNFQGWFESDQHVCFVMEYCRLGDISKCFPYPLPEVETRRVCKQLLEGLSLLHGMGITHRDIKPQNVLVVQSDPIWVKIADFGISKRAIDDETDLRTQIGTQGYMAPEIFDLVDNSKEDSSYTSAVDLWSLGCLLYYLLTKETPFSVYELQTYARGHTEFPHNSLITRKVSFPGRSFIKSLLAPFPQDRPKASVGLMKDWAPEHRNTSSFTPHFTELGSKQNPQIHVAPDVTIDSQSTLLPEPIPLVEQQINEPMPKVEPEMSFYSYELWRVTKSTKSKTADAEQLLPILDHNANPSIIRDGYNAFHFAAQYGSAEWVKILLEYQADVTKPTIPRCETALHLATWQGDLEIFLKKLQSLQKHKIDVSAQNFDGDTALHLAITRFESVKAIEALLAAGASTEKKGRKGHTPLLYAMYLQREEKATVLLDGGANVNCQDGDGRTPLHLAIASNKMGTGLIRRLINDGADINKADRNGHTPLYDAVKLRKRDVVNMLLDCDAICELGDSGLQRYLVQVQMWRQGTRWLSSFFT